MTCPRRPKLHAGAALVLLALLTYPPACARSDDLPLPELEKRLRLRFPDSARRLRSHVASSPRRRVFVRVELAARDVKALTGDLCRLGPRSARAVPALPSVGRSWWSPAAAASHRYCQGKRAAKAVTVLADTTRRERPILYLVVEQ